MSQRIVIPAKYLAAEIEFAIAYTVACNPGRDLLGEDRKAFAEAIVGMITERAGEGVSGMRIVPGEENSRPAGTQRLTRRNLIISSLPAAERSRVRRPSAGESHGPWD